MAITLNGSTGIVEANIANNAITANKIATDAITTDKIISDAITTAKISNGAVSATDLASTLDLTGKSVTLPSGVGGKLVGYNINLQTDGFAYSVGASWTALSQFDLTYAATNANSKIKITFYMGLGGLWSLGNTQGFRFKMGDNYPNRGTFSSDPSEKAHASVSMNWSTDGNHGVSGVYSAWLGTPGTTSSMTYRVEFGCESGGTLYIGRTANLHSGTFVGLPSASYLLVEEYA